MAPVAYKFTAEEKDAFLHALSAGKSIVSICEMIGIDPSTYRYARLRDENFARGVELAKKSRDELVEDALYRSALKGNVIAQIFWLCNRAAERWKNVQQRTVDVSVRSQMVEIKRVQVEMPLTPRPALNSPMMMDGALPSIDASSIPDRKTNDAFTERHTSGGGALTQEEIDALVGAVKVTHDAEVLEIPAVDLPVDPAIANALVVDVDEPDDNP